MILKILASALTGIGGHYMNRRWDKAILFLCLFVIYWAAAYALFIFTIKGITFSPDDFAQKIDDATQVLLKTLIGIVILWLVSLIITILDCKNNIEPNIVKWTKPGITGAVLTSILSFVFLAATVTTYISLSKSKIAFPESASYESDTFNPISHNFYEYLYFGGAPSNSRQLPAPPTGEGILKGEISYENNPADGVTLAVILNSKYRAKDIVTDSNGIFTVNLPPDQWIINSIQTESWEHKPQEGSFSMYSGKEEKLKGDSYNRYEYFQNTGYPVSVTKDSRTIHINATISKNIQLQWPDPNVEGIKATINDTISWEKYPEASRYYIEIKKIKREGTTTYFEQVTSRILANETSLPLSSLKHIKTNGKEKTEYAADIFAFSKDGTLIAEVSETHQGGTFLLSDGNILVEDELDNLYGLSSVEDPDEFEKKMEAISLNKQKASAVSVLIDEDMLVEAKELLKHIDSEYLKGKKEVLSGYIFALQGKCNKANEMFDKATNINPNVCIPDNYKRNCK